MRKVFSLSKAIIAGALSFALAVDSVQISSAAPTSVYPLTLSLPPRLGTITDYYCPSSGFRVPGSELNSKLETRNSKPDFILIQDLHVNRSVQFAISGILKRLQAQGLMPDHIAVEGATGPVDIASMQRYPDPVIRKEAADYLVRQGEMPGAMHYVVTEGEGGLFGIETDEYYKANLEMFRRSYVGRTRLLAELRKVQAVLPRLKKDAAIKENTLVLEKDLEAVNALVSNQVSPDALPATLQRASSAVEHLKLVLTSYSLLPSGGEGGDEGWRLTQPASTPHPHPLPASGARASSSSLLEPLSASINFYALALLRNDELFKNVLAVRELGRTTEGRPYLVAVVSAEGTVRDLEPHRRLQARLAHLPLQSPACGCR